MVHFMICHSKKMQQALHLKLSQRITRWDRIRVVFAIHDNICLDMRSSSSRLKAPKSSTAPMGLRMGIHQQGRSSMLSCSVCYVLTLFPCMLAFLCPSGPVVLDFLIKFQPVQLYRAFELPGKVAGYVGCWRVRKHADCRESTVVSMYLNLFK